MMDTKFDALRAELTAAQAVGTNQVAGLRSLAATSLTPPLLAAVTDELGKRTSRADLISDSIRAVDNLEAALSALVADGYPNVPKATMDKELFAALQAKVNAATEAMNAFQVG
jgi:hypothetical protein